MKKLFYLLALATVSLTACKKDLGGSNERLQAILLGKDTLKMWVGEVRQINFRTNPSDFDTTSFVWNSSDPSVISVTNLGKITALKTGTSKVSVSNQANTLSVSCQITVVPLIDSLKLGLIAYYPFNNSAADSSGNFNDGTVHGATLTTNRFGTPNSAYYFDGSSSYIDVKDSHALRLNNTDFTINYWVNLDVYTTSSGSAVIEKNAGPGQQGWNIGVTGYGSAGGLIGKVGVPFFNESGGSDPFAAGNGVVGTGNWVMVTILYDFSTQQMSFYENGVFDNVTSNILPPNGLTNVDMFIGKNTYAANSTPPYFIQGKLDDIRIYGKKLKNSDITKLFNLTY